MVDRGEEPEWAPLPGRVDSQQLTDRGEAQRLVEDHPVLDPITESPGDDRDVLLEPIEDLAVGPAAPILERLGKVPVVERHPWLDAAGEALVHHPAVEVEPG